MKIHLDTTIKELHANGIISVRTYNCLRNVGMNTLEDVKNFVKTPLDLMNIRNFGKKSYAELEPLLREVWLMKNPQKPKLPKEIFAMVDLTISGMLREAYETLFVEDNDVTRFFRACYPSVAELHSKVTDNEKNLLEIHGEFSMAENVEIRKMYARYLEDSTRRMLVRQSADNKIYAGYKETLLELQPRLEEFSYKDKVEHFISPGVRCFLQSVYIQTRNKKLSVRGRNFAERFVPNFEILATLFDSPLSEYKKLCPNKTMMKTLTELFRFNQLLKELFDSYWQMSDDELQLVVLKQHYPFLNSIERRFVYEHQRESGFYPLFFILFNYMRLSEEKSNKIFSLLYGIFDGKERTLNELADLMGLTRERIRQITAKKLEVHETNLIQCDDWGNYADLLALPFITQESEEYNKLKVRERLTFDFRVFVRLMQLIGEYETIIVNNAVIAINRKAMPSIKIGDCLASLHALVSSRYTNDTLIDISASLNKMGKEEQPDSCRLMIYIARECLGLEVVDDQKILVRKNYIDVAEDLYAILANKGEPMSIDEMFEAFKHKNPGHKYTDSNQIRTHLFRHPSIKPIGNTSRYGLESWKNIFYGTIRDLLVELLQASKDPMHIKQLYEAVLEHYPKTSIKSLDSTMKDSPGRFVQFNDGYFGLRGMEYDVTFEEVNAERQRFCFKERFADFRRFVEEYNRYPVSCNGDYEASLHRWLYNVQNNVLDITEEEKKQLEDSMKFDESVYIPRNSTENEFRNNCRSYKEYINSHYTLPSVAEEPDLYAWMKRSMANYNSYVDHRRKYLTDLLYYIQSLGFSI